MNDNNMTVSLNNIRVGDIIPGGSFGMGFDDVTVTEIGPDEDYLNMMRIVVVGPKGRSIYCRTFGGRDITVIRN
jgi:hypothetical protein